MASKYKKKQNVFNPRQTRYIKLSSELQQFLEEKYADAHRAGYDFNIQHINNRYMFDAPEELTDTQKRDMANRIADIRAEREEEEKAKREDAKKEEGEAKT
ncbi:hypothetical protein B0H63DRAFT_477452 [Podospora didyma]|uniref:Uncharacterized protein n=1 Tax=Podospora didyma TaxID=330526 RepID=A0AAE0KJ44_9PEZI|nr:hypothetical protein B0H63DRAFT_477452 [Podospora didyma]